MPTKYNMNMATPIEWVRLMLALAMCSAIMISKHWHTVNLFTSFCFWKGIIKYLQILSRINVLLILLNVSVTEALVMNHQSPIK